MIKIEIVRNEKAFSPTDWVKKKIDHYHECPDELLLDVAVVLAISKVVERGAYTLNAITRARK